MTWRRRLEPWARRVAALAALLTFVVAWASAGRSYFWCIPTQQIMATCCSEGSGGDDDGKPIGPSARSRCCEERSIDALPTTDAPEGSFEMALPPPITGLADLPIPIAGARRTLPVGVFAPLRRVLSRAAPTTALARCVSLQVFQC